MTRARLVGQTPSLQITDAGTTPGIASSPYTGFSRPKVPLSRLTLKGRSTDAASVAEFSFCVDQALTKSWRAGDVLHVARTNTGALAMSTIRGGRLVMAVGAVTAVPTADMSIRTPWDAINEAADVIRRLDPDFAFREFPIEFHFGAETRVLYTARASLSGYRVFVEHGVHRGLPGAAECAAVFLAGSCPETPAIFSAQLMEYQDLSTMIRW